MHISRLLVAASLATCVHVVMVRADEPLPTDPALVTGKLDNGLSYIVRKHGNPEGRAAVWMHVNTGSLNETDKQRGIAHYLEHMAFNGSKNFPPGSVIDFFQSLGLAFGRDQNAFTSFDQTTYQLYLPNTQGETIDKALLFMSDVAGRLSLLPREIDEERGIIQEEKRTRLSAQQRVSEYILERIAPESTFGQRLPIGTDATLKTVMQPDFLDYYNRYYVPSNMTVIFVGDTDPAPVVEHIKKAFADGKKAEPPKPRDVGVKPTKGYRAIVATDPELKTASVTLTRIDAPVGPTTTLNGLRRDLIDTIGQFAFNRRLGDKLAAGKATYLSASATLGDEYRVFRQAEVQANGTPEKWQAMVADLATEVRRATLHGFKDSELDDAKKSILSNAEEGVARESTTPARNMIARLNGNVADGDTIMSAAQRLDLLKKILPSISTSEVSEAFTRNFDFSSAVFVCSLPAGGGVPSEADLVKFGTDALKVAPAPEAEKARATSLLKEPPVGGKVAESKTHEASGVASGWLDNGVRFHHRQMDQRKDDVTISITLAGGQIEETADNRGISDVAALAWNRPATSTLSSTQIRDFMTGKKVSVRGGDGGGGGGRGGRGGGGGGSSDAFTLTVSGSPTDLETGMQLAYLLLTDPVIEPAAFEQWKTREFQQIESRKVQPQGTLQELVANNLYPPNEARMRPLQKEQVERLTVEQAQAWLKRILTSAPIEVAVVGDIKQDAAEALVSRYLGSLGKRDRINDKTLANLRQIKHVPGPVVKSADLRTETKQAVVMDGFFAADAKNVRDTRLMQLAARLVSTRLVKIIREEKQLVYSISAQTIPGTTYPGWGQFIAAAPTAPEKADLLGPALDEVYTAFAKGGPTAEEMDTARKQFANQFEEQMKEPTFWQGRLATLSYRGMSLDDTMQGPAAFQAFTADEVRDTFAKYYKPESAFRFSVKPTAGAAPAAKAEGEKKGD